MSMDFSLTTLSPLTSADPTAGLTAGGTEASRIKQVSKAMESIFTGQLMSEMGKSIDGDDSKNSDAGPYSDFIQQAMTQGMTQGGGMGLAKVIENYLTNRNAVHTDHLPLKVPNNSYHVNSAS